MESSKTMANVPIEINLFGKIYQIWNSQLSYYVNTSGFVSITNPISLLYYEFLL